ncbi:MAG: TetR/AcrR family transcriptional regulator [Actinobacteria bacterium]|nr:TetR/AcrR family transcriptional regulator [Actinomycetota bacterium]
MSQPRLPRRQRRAQLLNAAREVFVETGYHAASMDDIAARAGVTKPVLYQHFGSKRDLYLAVLDSGAMAFAESIELALQSTANNQERVTATVSAYLDFMSRDDATYRLVFESDLVNAPDVRERVERVNHMGATMVARIISEDTDLSEEEAMLLAYGLMGMAQSAGHRFLTGHEHIDKHTAAKLVAGLAWRGISGFPRSDNQPLTTAQTLGAE